MKFSIKKCVFAILLIGLLGYIIGMLAASILIHNELQIDGKKLEDYAIKQERCDLVNASILSVFGYSCSKPECGKCINNCMAPKIIDVDQYKCILLSIYNDNKMVYYVTMNGCLSEVDTSKFVVNRNAMDNESFFLGLVFGIGGWMVVFLLYVLYIIVRRRQYNRI